MKITSDLYAIGQSKKISKTNYLKNTSSKNISSNNVSMQGLNGISNTNKVALSSNLIKSNNIVNVSFTGNPLKNSSQILFITPEVTNFFNECYNSGGMGAVENEQPANLHKVFHIDARRMLPYHSYDNPGGQLKTIEFQYDKEGNPIWLKDEKGELLRNSSGAPIHKYVIKEVPYDYVIPQELDGKEFYTIIGKPKMQGDDSLRAYKIMEDTGIVGKVKSITEDMRGTQEVPYRIFKQTDKNGVTNYIMHLPGTASWSHCYNENGPLSYSGSARQGSGSSFDNGGHSFQDFEYGIFGKACTDAAPKLAKEGESFNPASISFADRHSFIALTSITEESNRGNEYWRGMRFDSRYHNPTEGYQGAYRIPMDFFRIVGGEEDFESLKNAPGYDFVVAMSEKIINARNNGAQKIEDILTKDELAKLDIIFEPFIGRFKDSKGRYNLCMIPIANKRINPFTSTLGTVSKNFGMEMGDANTPDIARSLTSSFASTQTIDIVNGSTPASLGLDKTGRIGKGILNTGATEGYTPLPVLPKEFSELSEADKIKAIEAEFPELWVTAKDNKKWLLDTLGQACEETSKGTYLDTLSPIEEIFFEKGMVFDVDGNSVVRKNNPACIVGSLSKYQEGDVLLNGWGRGVDQKGYPAALQGFIEYLKSDAPQEEKSHVKLILGGGGWTDTDLDWRLIKDKIKQIEELGHKGQVMYVNGFFPNKLIACSDFGFFTSRFEPCGITPLETFSAGRPVISHHTGGAPDFVTSFNPKKNNIHKATGFLTRHAFCLSKEAIEETGTLTQDEIKEAISNVAKLKGAKLTPEEELDAIRLAFIGKENATCISDAVKIYRENPSAYQHMMKNARKLEVDWHNNGAFNGGISANELYLTKVFNINPETLKPLGEQDCSPLKPLISSLANSAYARTLAIAEAETAQNMKETAQSATKETIAQLRAMFANTAQSGKEAVTSACKNIGKIGKTGAMVAVGATFVAGLIKYCDVQEAKANKEALSA